MAIASAPCQTGRYFYGITVAEPMAGSRDGVGGAAVELVVEGGLAAVVSRLGAGKVRPQRAHLAAHHRVLRDLAGSGPCCRWSSAPSVGGDAELRRVLRQNHDEAWPPAGPRSAARWRWD